MSVRIGQGIDAHQLVPDRRLVLAGVEVGFAAAVGALSLVTRRVRPFEVVHGNPIRRTGKRDREQVLALDTELRERAAAAGVALPHHDLAGVAV